MKHVIYPVCGSICIKYGNNKSGSQRWRCKKCSSIYTPKINNSSKQLQIFLKWLFGKQSQMEMPGERRTFRRKTSQFWEIWPLPPKIEESKVVVSDGGTGFTKALKKAWPKAKHQRCLFHVFCQIRRYTTSKPKTAAGLELYILGKALLHLETK